MARGQVVVERLTPAAIFHVPDQGVVVPYEAEMRPPIPVRAASRLAMSTAPKAMLPRSTGCALR